jgi:hypothetical protein
VGRAAEASVAEEEVFLVDGLIGIGTDIDTGMDFGRTLFGVSLVII